MFTKTSSWLLLCCAFVLNGCNSFNSYHFPPLGTLPGPIPVPPKVVDRLVEKSTVPDCGLYDLPEQTMTPPLPSLDGIDRDDIRTYDLIQQRHINELRMYIRDYKRQIVKTYAAYLRRCGGDTSQLVP